MGVPVDIARPKYETATQLKRVLAQADLLMSSGLGPRPGTRIVGPEQVQHIGTPQTRRAVSEPLLIDQKWKPDSRIVAEHAGISLVAQTDGGQVRSFFPKGGLVLAQLRDMLTAENSAIVPQENEDCGLPLPECAEAVLAAIRIRQDNGRQRFTQSLSHCDASVYSVIPALAGTVII